jgi:DNA-binding NarL/FixJ family response regulator
LTVLRAKSLNPKNRITVLLVDDHKGIRTELRKILEAESDIHVVGEAANGKQAVDMAKKLRPSVVVMDISMPKLNGLEATRQILQGLPATRVLICSAYSDMAYVERAMEVGAAGYIIKLTVAKDLVATIRAVQKGETFF